MAVLSGQCDVALAVGVEKMTHARTSTVTEALNCALDHEADAATGLTYRVSLHSCGNRMQIYLAPLERMCLPL